MSHHHRRSCTAVIIVLALALPATALRAAPSITDALKGATSLKPEDRKVIEGTVKALVTDLASDKPDVQRGAREKLVSLATINEKDAEPAYLDELVRQLNAAIGASPAFGPAGKVRTRLNAAIVTARIAEKAPTPRAEDLVRRFIGKDAPDCVVLWGVKAAKPIIARSLRQGTPSPLVGELLPAVSAHPSGAIAQEAYDALAVTDAKPQVLLTASVPNIISILKMRLKLYDAGAPDDPEAEEPGLLYLTRKTIWTDVLSPAERLDTAQIISDLATIASREAANADNPDDLLRLVKYCGSCLYVVAGILKNDELGQAVLAATSLKPGDSPQRIAAAAEPIYPALKKIPDFGKLRPPPAPKADGPRPATAPAKSGPTTRATP